MNALGLEKIGLKKTEAEVYKDLVEYGESAPPKVAERTGINRENVYFVLKRLKEMGLVKGSERKGKQVFRPLHPKNLKNLISKEKEELTGKEKALDELIPELSNIFLLNDATPSVSFFKGITGIKEMYEDVYRGENPGEIIAFRSVYDAEFLKNFSYEDYRRLKKEGIKTKVLSSKKSALPAIFNKSKFLVQEKIIEKLPFDLPAEVAVYNNKVLIASFKRDKVGAIIEGKEIADTMRIIFNYIWEKK